MQKVIGIGKYGVDYLHRKFPANPPRSVERAWKETMRALRLNAKKYRLVYIPARAVRWAERPGKVGVGELGCCVGRTAYVVHSDHEGREGERITAIHEALHFVFGDHPWPSVEGQATALCPW